MRVPLTASKDNFPMIMEVGAEVPNLAQMQLAVLSGNNAVDYYDMLSPDEHGLYDRAGESGFKPHGPYIDEVRLVNRLLRSDPVDLALNAQGQGLFVHNWDGKSLLPTTDAIGISFTPATARSQAISIKRSTTEVVLMNTLGGTFHFPSALHVHSATIGRFDSSNRWVKEGEQPFSAEAISPAAGTTVRLEVDKLP